MALYVTPNVDWYMYIFSQCFGQRDRLAILMSIDWIILFSQRDESVGRLGTKHQTKVKVATGSRSANQLQTFQATRSSFLGYEHSSVTPWLITIPMTLSVRFISTFSFTAANEKLQKQYGKTFWRCATQGTEICLWIDNFISKLVKIVYPQVDFCSPSRTSSKRIRLTFTLDGTPMTRHAILWWRLLLQAIIN